MNAPKVSVIIPIYNVEGYVSKCLESLLSQTFPDFEVLCIDDASADHSVRVIREFQQKDPRIRLLQQEHAGVSAARNLGIANARGEYIAFVDGDDWLAVDALEKMVTAADSKNADVVVSSAEVHFENPQPEDSRRNASLVRALTVTKGLMEGTPWKALAQPGSWPFLWNKLIRRELIIENAVTFSPTLALGEDGAFLVTLFQYVAKVAFIHDTLYHYRYQRKASATVNLFQSQQTRFSQHVQVARVLLEEFRARKMLDGSILNWIVQFLYYDFAHLAGPGKMGFSQELQELSRAFELSKFEKSLGLIERRRLKRLTTPVEDTKLRHLYGLVEMKIENRILGFLARNRKN